MCRCPVILPRPLRFQDTDHDGTLDVPDLRLTLKTLYQAAAMGDAEAEAMRARIAHYEKRIQAAHAALAATQRLAETKRALDQSASGVKTVRDRLGTMLADKTAKTNVNELVNQWGGGSGNKVSKAAFRTNVAKLLGAEGKAESDSGGEIESLFDSLDNDGSGEMDSQDLKNALRTLQDYGKQDGARAKLLQRQAKERGLEAREAQEALKRLLDEDEEAEAATKEREEQEKKDAAIAAEAARQARRAARKSKEAEDEAKRRAFEAKVAAKSSSRGPSKVVRV